MQFCGDREGAKARGMYICNYCSKNDTDVKHMLPIFYTIRRQKHKSKAPDAEKPERKAIFFLTRALNKFASLQEYSQVHPIKTTQPTHRNKITQPNEGGQTAVCWMAEWS